jgi:2-phospho-L-lactate guanylyltransferase
MTNDPAQIATPAERRWHILIPVRGTTASKTRILPAASDGFRRRELALAFASDAIIAAMTSNAVTEVSVITGDLDAGSLFTDLGATVIPEAGTEGLNAAIRHGLRSVGESHPLWYRAVLMSDVPTLTASDLDAVLELACRYRLGVVPDAAGTGTVMLTAAPGAMPVPHFGIGSHARHRSVGMQSLVTDLSATLRRDVDTPADLAAAIELGVGPHTRAALGSLGILPTGS